MGLDTPQGAAAGRDWSQLSLPMVTYCLAWTFMVDHSGALLTVCEALPALSNLSNERFPHHTTQGPRDNSHVGSDLVNLGFSEI